MLFSESPAADHIAASGHRPFLFLSFPPELRARIYDIYLNETIVRIPGPALPNTLDLLATCRLIYNEASPGVISRVTFSVWCTEELLYFLSSLPDEKLRALRHVAVWASPVGFYLEYPNRPFFTTHLLPDVLHYISGLQLDTLVIRDGFHGPGIDEDGWGNKIPYNDVQTLLSKGKGWRELRYYTPCTMILDAAEKEQPKNWSLDLTERDGKGSGAEVRMLVGKELAPYQAEDEGSEEGEEEVEGIDSNTQEQVQANPGSKPKDFNHHINPSEISWEYVDENLPWREEDFTCFSGSDIVPKSVDKPDQPRPIVVIVRRGRDAHIVQDAEGARDKLQALWKKYTWKEMKEKGILLSGHDAPNAML
ncbi:hypothetical protein BDN72DRAFT_837047 [Pluteus cervinus]|uniref:Uncharacterized protein n=1 Tax=Pluteus cervinus TaxID=181527 RepID=A0ACD3B295_9AGAR|nr:hypothetical protein BDN72DRAFT_837047 [Pluteus cervinus]